MPTVTCSSVLCLASMLYLPQYSTLGQIQHSAFEVYNMEIKVHFSL